MMPSQKFGIASPSTENIVATWSGQRPRFSAAMMPAVSEITSATTMDAAAS